MSDVRPVEKPDVEQVSLGASDPYWLAFLLTGQKELSLDLTIEALESAEDSNLFFSNWMLAWSRRVFMAKALAAIRQELTASARRTAAERFRQAKLPRRDWSLNLDTSKADLEKAILSIDAFPRCAMVLTIFERVSVEDVAVLLDSDRELVRKAQRIGLQELTRNLARIQGWKLDAPKPRVAAAQMQHA
jgi:DNA-directed RNA polymerase specialized sigma24 family protein